MRNVLRRKCGETEGYQDEQEVAYSDINVVERRVSNTGNRLAGGNRRDTVKFVVNRLPCACLKMLHSATRKKLAKVGVCNGCHKQFPRSQLHICTGCMIDEYCSKECQTPHWSIHKQFCGFPEVMSRDLPPDYVWLIGPDSRLPRVERL